MGNKNSNKKLNKNKLNEKVSKASFEYLQIIGKGGFGKVWKVYSRKFKLCNERNVKIKNYR